jgi:hypothetical protein
MQWRNFCRIEVWDSPESDNVTEMEEENEENGGVSGRNASGQ